MFHPLSRTLVWLAAGLLVGPVLWWLMQWALWQAVFRPDVLACQTAQGACWGVLAEKWRLILFGRLPEYAHWRAAVALLLWTVLLAATVFRPKIWKLWLLAWPLAWVFGMGLMHGGPFGLQPVASALWGGLPLTLIISTVGFAAAFPLGVVLALGRQSTRRPVRLLCTSYIEILRALPLVSVLFLAAFVVPLLLPGPSLDLLTRVVGTIALFSAAYLAEVIRGGLQSVPAGQTLAAKALGMGYWQIQVAVVLPQAIRACLPALTNSFVTLFKECSLVSIVALFELTGALSLALGGDVQWRQFYLEAYLAVALLYWAYCFGLSKAVK